MILNGTIYHILPSRKIEKHFQSVLFQFRIFGRTETQNNILESFLPNEYIIIHSEKDAMTHDTIMNQ